MRIPSWRFQFPRHWRSSLALGLAIVLGVYYLHTTIAVLIYAQQPIDGVLVLGGSIQREVYAAKEAAQLPRPILISGGSPAPCVQYLFDREQQSQTGVWIEPCATSTFENFAFAVPFLQSHHVHHVLVITSGNHYLRAGRLGTLMLGFHGIAVTMQDIPEPGIPGNHESALKTRLDVVRGLIWGILSPVLPPYRCEGISLLTDVPPPIVPNRCEREGRV